MSERADAVVIGGGIMGLALSVELRRLGARRIVVLERRYVGSGATSRNIGRVRTSQFSPDLARFAAAAFSKHLRLADELGANTLFWRPGYALVFYDAEELTPIGEVRRSLRELGMEPEYHEGRAVQRRLPVLDGGEQPRACLIRPDGVVHHDALVFGYRRAALRLGVEIREGVTVRAIETAGGSVRGVVTDTGEIRTDLVINAAGGWSREVSAMAGLKVPNTPLRREAIVTESSRPFMDTMISFYRPLEGWFHQTLRGEIVAGVVHPQEPPGLEHRASPAALGRIAHHILRKAPRLAGLRVVRQWAGVYDVTPDRKAMIGPATGLSGFIQANGDNGRGIAFTPYIAELLAGWIDGGARPAVLEPFDPSRYDGREETPVQQGDYYAAYRKTSPPSTAAAVSQS